MRAANDKFGVGMKLLAPSKLAVRESLLPSETSHDGPPLYKRTKNTGSHILVNLIDLYM